jgi:hypothetical protein
MDNNAKLQNLRTTRRLREMYTLLSVSLFDITLYSLFLIVYGQYSSKVI